jgi:hypothetical protein
MPSPRTRRRLVALIGVVVATLVAGGGCASRRAAAYADPALGQTLTEQIVLMPIVDQRAERFDPFDVARDVRVAAPRVLAKKGYTAVAAASLDGAGRPPFEGFESLSARELAALGPEGGETLLFLGVTEVRHTYGGGGDEYRVRVTGTLVDKRSQRVLWRDSGSGTTNFGGLLSVMTPEGSRHDAVYEALTRLLRTVPDRIDRSPGPRRGRS